MVNIVVFGTNVRWVHVVARLLRLPITKTVACDFLLLVWAWRIVARLNLRVWTALLDAWGLRLMRWTQFSPACACGICLWSQTWFGLGRRGRYWANKLIGGCDLRLLVAWARLTAEKVARLNLRVETALLDALAGGLLRWLFAREKIL